MEQTQQQPASQPPQAPQVPPEKTAKKGEEEFSTAWHLKVLAVIYVVLGIFYLILKFTLK